MVMNVTILAKHHFDFDLLVLFSLTKMTELTDHGKPIYFLHIQVRGQRIKVQSCTDTLYKKATFLSALDSHSVLRVIIFMAEK